jgi:Resolvase, N terminal domain
MNARWPRDSPCVARKGTNRLRRITCAGKGWTTRRIRIGWSRLGTRVRSLLSCRLPEDAGRLRTTIAGFLKDAGARAGNPRREANHDARSARSGDTLVVWKLDRLSRSLKDLLTILERVSAAGAKFRSLTESIDTSGPAGRMLMQMLGSFAEFEREMIRERTRAGLHEARAQGRVALAIAYHKGRYGTLYFGRGSGASGWPKGHSRLERRPSVVK